MHRQMEALSGRLSSNVYDIMYRCIRQAGSDSARSGGRLPQMERLGAVPADIQPGSDPSSCSCSFGMDPELSSFSQQIRSTLQRAYGRIRKKAYTFLAHRVRLIIAQKSYHEVRTVK